MFLHWCEKAIRASFWLVPLMLATTVGCTDGPFFALKKLNPVIQSQWKKDRERGPVYSQRVEEIRFLRGQIARMSESEKDRWVGVVSKIVETETSADLRRESLLALSEVMDRPEATTTIVKLAQDKNDKVRLEAAKALKKSVTPETTQTLLAMASNDTSESVRLAATESLGTHRSDEVKQFLAKQLNDRKPSVQYYASLALKDYTGKDFKGDVSKWKKYLDGEEVEATNPGLAEYFQSYLPMRR